MIAGVRKSLESLMRIARFDDNRVGIVRDDGIHDVTSALDALPQHRYPFPRHDALGGESSAAEERKAGHGTSR